MFLFGASICRHGVGGFGDHGLDVCACLGVGGGECSALAVAVGGCMSCVVGGISFCYFSGNLESRELC